MEGITKFDLENQAIEKQKVEALNRIADVLEEMWKSEDDYNVQDISANIQAMQNNINGIFELLNDPDGINTRNEVTGHISIEQ